MPRRKLTNAEVAWTAAEPRRAFKRLISALVEEAASDVNMLKRSGVISAGQINPDYVDQEGKFKYCSRVFTYTSAVEVKSLIGFFNNGGCGKALELAGFTHISAEAIIKKIKLNEVTYPSIKGQRQHAAPRVRNPARHRPVFFGPPSPQANGINPAI